MLMSLAVDIGQPQGCWVLQDSRFNASQHRNITRYQIGDQQTIASLLIVFAAVDGDADDRMGIF